MTTKLRLTGRQHRELKNHLFPGDGKEAVALLQCGRLAGRGCSALSVNTILLLPHASCRRSPGSVTWSPTQALPLLERLPATHAGIVKIHSHPNGTPYFSALDDSADAEFFASVFGWADDDQEHVSAIMLPDGQIIARRFDKDGDHRPVDVVSVAGANIDIWHGDSAITTLPGFAGRHAQLFGRETVSRLSRLSVAVVGCSGTGSPLIEMLARLGVGKLVLVDPDRVEVKNLNRIYNATREDAVLGRTKVEVMGRAIARMGLGTEVDLIAADLAIKGTIRAVASCDAVFGCTDGARGRQLLNRLATFYSVPYFDLGVRLDADGSGGISEAASAVHYLEPDGPSLQERGVYSAEQLQSETLRFSDPKTYRELLRAGYIRNANEDRPAVISINTQTAAVAINEFLARLHPYRTSDNEEFAAVRTSFIHGAVFNDPVNLRATWASRLTGRGDVEPLLDMPQFSAP